MQKNKIKQLLALVSAGFLAVSIAQATAVQFTVEVDQMIVNGNPIDKAERDAGSYEALGFFISGGAFAAFTSDDAWGAGSSVSTDAYAAILSLLNSNGLGSATSIAAVPGALPITNLFQGTVNSGAAGNHAVLVLHNAGAGNFGSLTEGDAFAVVTTTFQTLGFGTEAIGFNTANTWDTTLVGNPGSVELAQVVPEPSSFALLAGCFGLAWVMVRRRA